MAGVWRNPALLQVDRLRVSQLGSDGTPVATTGKYVVTSLISMTISEDNLAGDSFQQKLADGTLCVNYKTPDIPSGGTVALQLCAPHLLLRQMLMGGVNFVDADTIARGYGYPRTDGSDLNSNGVCIEAWVKNVLNDAQLSDFPYSRIVFPRVRYFTEADRTHENGPTLFTITGEAIENPNIGNGPLNDFPTTMTGFDATRWKVDWYESSSSLPAITSGSGTLPAGPQTAPREAASVTAASQATKDELYERATELDIKGRATMSKDELAEAVTAAEKANQ